ncbi:MAG: aspartate aminotransferase family protein [Chloroflexi bacterium]|nr:aspartate aminotransferase family protein [Chloroflexota bacterium]|tara:strand:- start:2257 stop:3660 length:1404 start_codon:yes stop_codon:yes gene_type:complete
MAILTNTKETTEENLQADLGLGRRENAKTQVRHFLADFARLEVEYPGIYPHIIERGEGVYVIDDQGRYLLDAGNHLGACNIGHGRHEVANRMAQQAERLEFSALDSGNSHDAVIGYAKKLAEILPIQDACLSFCGSGSEGNELAIKIARAYHGLRGESNRTKILSRVGSYHGSSYAAMTATGIDAFSAGFGPMCTDFASLPQPSHDRCTFCGDTDSCNLGCIDGTRRRINEEGSDTIAAIIAEPISIVQAVKIPHPEYWQQLHEICRETGALLIADEVVTGFGRTGRMFGCEHWDVYPDIMVMAKGITSGYMPFGAVAVTGKVNEVFHKNPLLHLNTYAGHPVACAAADVTLDILLRENLIANSKEMESVLRYELEKIAQTIPQAIRVSVIGLMSSIEVNVSGVKDIPRMVRRVRHEAYQNDLLVRVNPDSDRISAFFYPPLTVTKENIIAGIRSLEVAFNAALADI